MAAVRAGVAKALGVARAAAESVGWLQRGQVWQEHWVCRVCGSLRL